MAQSGIYNRLSVFSHWFAALCIIALFLTHEGSGAAYAFHVGGGAVLGVLLIWRSLRRWSRGMSPKPAQHALLNSVSSIVLHSLLALIIIVTATGYLLPWSLGRPLPLFGDFVIPSPMNANRCLHEMAEEIHDIGGHLFIPLIGLHVLGAAKHYFIDKDSIAQRMFRSISGGI